MQNTVYIGNYNQRGKGGIGICRFDSESGSLEKGSLVFDEISVGNLLFDQKRRILYCADERRSNPQFFRSGGRIFALRAEERDGMLSAVDITSSYSSCPTYLAIDGGGNYLLSANFAPEEPVTKIVRDGDGHFTVRTEYSDAATILFPLDGSGKIGEPCDVYCHKEGSHIHSVTKVPGDGLFLACDLGADELCLLRIDEEKGRLVLQAPGPFPYRPGGGPRYSAFHPCRPFFFVNSEKRPFVGSFQYDGKGNIRELGVWRTIPEDTEYRPEYMQSDLILSRNGKSLYCLIRGLNLVAVFQVDGETGHLALIQDFALRGDGPRGGCLSPDGRFLLVAERNSGSVEVLQAADDGRLSFVGISEGHPCPAVVLFV